jgi:hypothetical protein
MPQELTLVVAALAAGVGVYSAYRRGRLRRTIALAIVLLVVPVALIWYFG